MRVTLLGTGCPQADAHRYGPAALVETGTTEAREAWLVDCGSGVTQRLLEHGTNGAAVTGLILTHLHSDHTMDLIQLQQSGWYQNRPGPLRVYGPTRTRAFIDALLAAWEPEMQQRRAYEMRTGRDRAVTVEPECIFETVERLAGELGVKRRGDDWPGWIYAKGFEVLAAENREMGEK